MNVEAPLIFIHCREQPRPVRCRIQRLNDGMHRGGILLLQSSSEQCGGIGYGVGLSCPSIGNPMIGRRWRMTVPLDQNIRRRRAW